MHVISRALRTHCVVAVLALTATLVTSVHADDIDEITVTATRIERPLSRLPFSADVVTRDNIASAQPLLGLDESLQQVPGLQMQNRFNFAQDLRISMRGFGARAAFGIRGIRIIVDGIPETLPDGQSGVDGIDLGSAQRIEVLRGGASAIYGNAGGGVILVDSRTGSDVFTSEVALAAGADGYQRVEANAAGPVGDWRYFAALSNLTIDGFRDHSEAENRQATLRLSYGAGEANDWLLSLHHTDQPIANDPGGVTISQYAEDPRGARDRNQAFDAGESLRQTRLGARYRHTTSRNLVIQTRGFAAQRDFFARLPFVGGGAIDLNRDFAGVGVQASAPVTFAGRALQWVSGVDFDLLRDARRRFDNNSGTVGDLALDQIERVSSLGLYSQLEWSVTETSDLTLGIRHDRLRFDVDDRFFSDGDDSGERDIRQWSPVIGYAWRPNDRTTVFANASRSFEAPTTTEFANPDGGGFNTNLDPAQALHREFGVRGQTRHGSVFSAALYRIDVQDELLPFELATNPGRDFFENAGSSDRQGIELAFKRQWSGGLSLQLMHTLSDFRFDQFVTDDGDDFSGLRTPGNARHRSFIALRRDIGDGRFAAVEAVRFGRVPVNNANDTFTDSYLLVNLRAGWQWQSGAWRYTPFFAINNLFDVDYVANTRINAFGGRFFESGPDRSVYLGIKAAFRAPGD